MDCPVCHNKNISPFATHCLECNADVVAFPLLDDLEHQCIDTLKDKVALEGDITALAQIRESDKKQYSKRMGRMYWCLLLFPLLFFWCAKKPIPRAVVENTDKINLLEKENQQLKADLQAAKDEITILSNRKDTPSQIDPDKDAIIHIVKKGESLSILAEKYLNDKNRWQELHKINPHIENPWVLRKGMEVKIHK